MARMVPRCGDRLGDARCGLAVLHVGVHQSHDTAWFGMVEFPHPRVVQEQEDWRKYNETSMRWHRELADWIGAEK